MFHFPEHSVSYRYLIDKPGVNLVVFPDPNSRSVETSDVGLVLLGNADVNKSSVDGGPRYQTKKS